MFPKDLPLLPHGLRTRIAPTPSGLLHLGNLASFYLTVRLATAAEGSVLLRIDDLDAERARSAYIRNIFTSLHLLGITWEHGPKDEDQLHREWSQRLRLPHYLALVEELRRKGHLYACACSRSDVMARTGSTRYDGHCRAMDLPFNGMECAWRLALPEECVIRWKEWPHGERSLALGTTMGDPVVRQRDGRPSYQVASLCDDVAFHINFIVRGEDLLSSTACQHYLADLLGLDEFLDSTFVHHPLLLDGHGEKLSKSKGDAPLVDLGSASGRAAVEHAAARSLDRVLGS